MSHLGQDVSPQILVVDDDPSITGLLSRWLHNAGYAVAHANNTATAWEQLTAHPVDLVTLDIRMPGCSGLDLLDRIKQQFPDIAVLMLSGEGDTSAAIRALTRGAFGYLIKPADRDELLIKVKGGLEMQRLMIDNRQYQQHLEDRVREQTKAIRQAHEETIYRLVIASLLRDEETGAHIRRTGLYSELLAATLGWESDRVDRIRLAAPMHDVGKIGIPDAILRKPGKLTAEETLIMQSHAVIGARMLGGSTSPVLQMAQEIALCHHERWDGTGYPSGLAGCAIPESARIVAIVDVYDALTHDRVYRPAFTEREVLSSMTAGRGTHFDPKLFDLFVSLLPEMGVIAETVIDEENEDDSVWTRTTDVVSLLSLSH